METLGSLDCFVRAADAGSFAGAARTLGLTSAAVGKNVATLERSLGVRLFARTTRSLTLTEQGQRLLDEVRGGLDTVKGALANATSGDGAPAGTLKVSMGASFGRTYVLPLLGEFLARYPSIVPDWHLDNRRVDLVREGYDVAIGGGSELAPGLVARRLARVHRVLVASTRYLSKHDEVTHPGDLARHPGILLRSERTGRIPPATLRDKKGRTAVMGLEPRVLLSDPEACCIAAAQHLGIALVTMPQALPFLDDGTLVRVLPQWYVDIGFLSIYHAQQRPLPRKTRAFVDFIVAAFAERRFAERLGG